MINTEGNTPKDAINRSAAAFNQDISMSKTKVDDVEVRKVEVWYEQGLIPSKVIPTKEIIRLMEERNHYLCDKFYSGEGVKLQNIDSHIMDYILQHFSQKGETVIPIHDSVLVRESLKEELYGVMEDAYEHIMGSKYNCVIEEK